MSTKQTVFAVGFILISSLLEAATSPAQQVNCRITDKLGNSRPNLSFNYYFDGINVENGQSYRLSDGQTTTGGASNPGEFVLRLPVTQINNRAAELVRSKQIRLTLEPIVQPGESPLATIAIDNLLGTDSQTLSVVMMESKGVYGQPANGCQPGCNSSRRFFRR